MASRGCVEPLPHEAKKRPAPNLGAPDNGVKRDKQEESEAPAEPAGQATMNGKENLMPIPEGQRLSKSQVHLVYKLTDVAVMLPCYNILPGMPSEALPQVARKGRLSYTISAKSGARVEVLLKHKAFRISRYVGVEKPVVLQRAWNENISSCWEAMKPLSGWDEPAAVSSA